ncbi:MAG: transposase [Selenomonadaceae bacterium]|nr:transposase [Selenomonadaceae bacterium]
MHINFAYDILNKNFLDCVIEAKNKADESKSAVKMLSALSQSEKILVIMDRGFDGLKMIEHCNRIPNLSYLIRVRSGK